MHTHSGLTLPALLGAGMLLLAAAAQASTQRSGGDAAVTAARAAAASPASARTGTPFVLDVEQRVKLEAPEWETLALRDLESRIVNATSESARAELQAQASALRERMDRDGACVLLGRSAARGEAGGRPTAVFVPAGMGGWEAERGCTVRVTPSVEPWPSMALGVASEAFPELRSFGTEARPAFVASAFEIVTRSDAGAGATAATTESAVRAIPTVDRSPWARRVPASLAASGSLVTDRGPTVGRAWNAWAPVELAVRNSATTSLPPSQVYFEFYDAAGNLLHREFRWLTERRTIAEEARLPSLAPNSVAVLQTVVPSSVASSVASGRVFIIRALPGSRG